MIPHIVITENQSAVNTKKHPPVHDEPMGCLYDYSRLFSDLHGSGHHLEQAGIGLLVDRREAEHQGRILRRGQGISPSPRAAERQIFILIVA